MTTARTMFSPAARLMSVLMLASVGLHPVSLSAAEGKATVRGEPARAPVEQASSAPAGPVLAIDDQLAQVMKLFSEKKTAEAFSEAEKFMAFDDRPPAERQEVRRARLLLAKFEPIRKLLPPPVASFDNALGQLLFTIAKTFEGGGESALAVKLFERIVAEYSKARFDGESSELIAKVAGEQIAWHKEKHPWVQPDLSGVLARLREALIRHDAKALASLVARKGFWSGPFQSEGGPDDPDRVLAQLEKEWPAKPVQIGQQPEPFSDPERQIFLRTSGWTGKYPEIYFIVEKVPGGWHWSAVAFALPPGTEVPEENPVPGVGGSPASPSPSPSPGK